MPEKRQTLRLYHNMRLGALASALCLAGGGTLLNAPLRFEKVSEHYYCLAVKAGGANVGVLNTEKGLLLVNPPTEPDLPTVLDALRRLASRPVRWVVSTDGQAVGEGGSGYFAKQGAMVLSSKKLEQRLLGSSNDSSASAQQAKGQEMRKEATPRFIFGRQMRLFPAGLEVRIFAPQSEATAVANVVVFVPAEKVLQVGDLYTPGSYPDLGGAASDGLAWIDCLKQVVDAVPLLKPAIAQPKPETAGAGVEEKSLEESVIVIPGRGPRSNLQEMKNLLESAQKLRAEVAKAVSGGRSLEIFLSSAAASPYRVYERFDAFAGCLYTALSKK